MGTAVRGPARSPTRCRTACAISRRSRTSSTAAGPASGACSTSLPSTRSDDASRLRPRAGAQPGVGTGVGRTRSRTVQPRLPLGRALPDDRGRRSERRFARPSTRSSDTWASARSAGTAATRRASAHGRFWPRRAGSSTTPTPTTTTCPTTCAARRQPWLVVPYAMDTNDGRYWFSPGFVNPNDFCDYLKLAFDRLHEEGRTCPKMMSIGLHCRISGRPGAGDRHRPVHRLRETARRRLVRAPR